ncbi:MAG: thioredoxin-disulfide reductase, partial [Chlamydiia bacterium]|nr:thioredoxin-disulfide reductase [Chlamydiia bacterium]
EPLLYEGFYEGPAGGQLMTTTEVENYPGFPDGVTGPKLMEMLRNQAKRFGTKILTEDVVKVDLSKRPFAIHGRNHTVTAEAVIIATGATANRLDVPGTRDGEFWQKGVTACAICDGAMPIFRNKKLYVVGGGDSAVEEATYLTKYAEKVYIVHRRDELRASKIMQKRAMEHPKIEILWNSVLTEVKGDDVVRNVVVQNVKTEQKRTLEAGGVFFAVGHTPNTKFLEGQLEMQNGYIIVTPGTTTTPIAGVFAAGDVQDHVYRQAVTAAGSGCMAAIEAERWLASEGLID